jgi:hypothetical protein
VNFSEVQVKLRQGLVDLGYLDQTKDAAMQDRGEVGLAAGPGLRSAAAD